MRVFSALGLIGFGVGGLGMGPLGPIARPPVGSKYGTTLPWYGTIRANCHAASWVHLESLVLVNWCVRLRVLVFAGPKRETFRPLQTCPGHWLKGREAHGAVPQFVHLDF